MSKLIQNILFLFLKRHGFESGICNLCCKNPNSNSSFSFKSLWQIDNGIRNFQFKVGKFPSQVTFHAWVHEQRSKSFHPPFMYLDFCTLASLLSARLVHFFDADVLCIATAELGSAELDSKAGRLAGLSRAGA